MCGGGAYTQNAVHTEGGAQRRWCTHKAVHTQGGAHTRRSVTTAGVLLFKGGAGAGPRVECSQPFVERSEPSRVRGGR